MLKANIKYLAFDDRKFTLWGIPTITVLIPWIFFAIPLEDYPEVAHQKLPESFVYCAFFWLTNRYLLIKLRERYSSLDQAVKRILIQFGFILLITPLVDVVFGLVIKSFYGLFGIEELCKTTFFQGAVATIFVSITVLALYEAIYFFYKYKAAIIEKEQLQQAHIQSQLDNLRNQINPHFLFNSLNTLMNLIPTDSDRAMNYLSKLSRFYRYAVGNREQASVPIQTELENLELYSDLLRERFGPSIEITLPEQIQMSGYLPPLSLQMLLENAVKHNIVSRSKPLRIEVVFDETSHYIWVKNNVQMKIQAIESTGMGLNNIRKRLAFFTNQPLQLLETKSSFEVGLPIIEAPQKVSESIPPLA
ncbi:MAG: histidine kinase [Bacteroidia bacterium]|nr:histidine kinase [Bacteroidia bacterium]